MSKVHLTFNNQILIERENGLPIRIDPEVIDEILELIENRYLVRLGDGPLTTISFKKEKVSGKVSVSESADNEK